MNQAKATLLNQYREIHEKVVGGFTIGGLEDFYYEEEDFGEELEGEDEEFEEYQARSFSGVSVKTARAALEVIATILHNVTLNTVKVKTKDKKARSTWRTILELMSPKQLQKAITIVFSPKYAYDQIKKNIGKVCSPSQIYRIKDWLSALGCFTSSNREMIRDDRGRFVTGANFGKKHAGELYDVDVPKLLLIASALMNFLAEQPEGLLEFRPEHAWAFLNEMWNRVIGIGSIAAPMSDAIQERSVREGNDSRELGQLYAAIDEQKELFARLKKAGRSACDQSVEYLRSLEARAMALADLVQIRDEIRETECWDF